MHVIPKHPGSQHIEGEVKDGVREEYFLILADSVGFTSQLALLAEVDKLDVVRVSEQIKSQSKGKAHD